eukprot:4660737-Alexandrium_andersonii.AAC.1
MTLVFSLLAHRWASLLWHFQAYPGKLALLLSDKVAEVQLCLEHMAETWGVWQKAKQSTIPLVKSWCKASYMNWVFVAEVFQALAAVDFAEVPAALLETLKD